MDIQTKSIDEPQKTTPQKSKRQLSNLEIAAFCEQIAMIVSAGLPTVEGVVILMEDAPDAETKAVLSSIYKPLEEGCSFHEALALSGVFPKYVLDMVEIGETSGKLDDVLSSLHTYYEREDAIRSGIKNAVAYPLIMITIMIAILLVLITKVLPIFNQIYTELGTGLSGFALAMMNFSSVINQYLIFVVLILVALLIAAIFLFKSQTGKILFKGKKLAINIAAGRFANCMSMALYSGLDTTQGLDFALNLVDNPHMEERIRRCKKYCDTGKSFSEAVMAACIFDKLYASMINIGTLTGSIDTVMDRIATEYEERVDQQISKLISTLEPTLIIILSVIIGFILISFLLPLLGIMSSIG